MPFQEDIEDQQKLLAAHRRTLAHLLSQRANFSAGFVPVHLDNGIQDARENIVRIKSILRDWGIQVENHPDDKESVQTKNINSRSYGEGRRTVSRERNKSLFPEKAQWFWGNYSLHLSPRTIVAAVSSVVVLIAILFLLSGRITLASFVPKSLAIATSTVSVSKLNTPIPTNMSAYTQTPSVTSGNSTQTVSHTIELVDLITRYLSQGNDFMPWATGAEPGTPIRWKTEGTSGCPSLSQGGTFGCREGDAIVTVNGKVVSYQLKQTLDPASWKIYLKGGGRIGFETVTIQQIVSTYDVDLHLPTVLEGSRITSELYKCEPSDRRDANGGNRVYKVDAQGKSSSWIVENWSCGSGGCWTTFDILYNPRSADAVQCFGKQ